MSSAARVAVATEWRRLIRTRLLLGLVFTFVFFGASGPSLATAMPDLIEASTGSEQITIEVSDPVPGDALSLYDQSAMQIGVVFAMAAVITGLQWDARTGSSIFYRTRVRALWAVTLPRVLVAWVAAVASYLLGLALTAVLTRVFIGTIPAAVLARVAVASVLYLTMAMCVAHLVMAAWRRVAPALAVSVVLILLVPLVAQVAGASEVLPTALLTAQRLDAGDLVVPGAVAVGISVLALVASVRVTASRTLRRES